MITGLVLQALWWYATSDYRLMDRNIDPRLVQRATRRNLMAPLIYLLAIATLGGFHTLWLDALSFGGPFLVIWRLPNFAGQIGSPLDKHVLTDLREGLRWLWKGKERSGDARTRDV